MFQSFKVLYRSGIISVATDAVGGVYWTNRFPATRIVNAGKWFNEDRFKESMQEIDLQIHNPAFCLGIHAWSFWNKFDQAEDTFTKVGNHNPYYWYGNISKLGY